ncbi:hypothetical protein OG339_13145 [Streptosporangium sp. NBC_01495]|uniref:hypothetical protein n=1 Tax=Streptosporangium sp. NBC_01495 TaxID=2903899 RepID=UPI002E309FCC|nr:hypothetical protein [Streptosporangium sp. NBC_01495]
MTGTAPVAPAVWERPVAPAVRERREIATRAVRWAVTHDDGGVTTGWVAEVATPPATGAVRREPVRGA